MNEMLNNYFNVIVIAEWVTFISSLFILDSRTKEWRLFKLLLFIILCAETTGAYLTMVKKIFDNALPFNLLMLISTVFFMWFLMRAKELQKIRKWLIFFSGLFVSFGLLNMFFFQGFWKYNTYSEALGDIILSVTCCYFLFVIVRNEEHIELLQFDYFWLANGILFYSLGNALFYPFSDLFYKYYLHTNINIGQYIIYTLNLILYSSLIIAFLCRRKTTR